MRNKELTDAVHRDLRRGVDLPAFVYRGDARIPVLITDISYDGCQVQVHADLVPGECLTVVHVRLGEVEAEVRWFTSPRAGLRFL